MKRKTYTLETALLFLCLWFCSHWNKQELHHLVVWKQDLGFTDPDSLAVSVEHKVICCLAI